MPERPDNLRVTGMADENDVATGFMRALGLPRTDYPELAKTKKEIDLLEKVYSLYIDVTTTVALRLARFGSSAPRSALSPNTPPALIRATSLPRPDDRAASSSGSAT